MYRVARAGAQRFPAGARVADRFLIERTLGHGSLGTTYLAQDELRGEQVALKVVPAAAAPTLRDELLALRGLFHPHLQQVHDFALLPDGAALASTYLPGSTLGREEFASWRKLRTVLADVAAALAFLHDVGVVHGDVKPDNVVVDRQEGRATLIDLSCSRAAGFVSSTLAGTPAYLSPESARDSIQPTRDVFAFGRMAFEIAQSNRLDVPAPDTELLNRCVASDPNNRPPHGRALAEALGVDLEPLRLRTLCRSAFVGRAAEIAILDAFLDAPVPVVVGAKSLHMLGRRGAGKTRLLDEVRWQAQLRMRVVEARPRHERSAAGGVVRAMIERAIRHPLEPNVESLVGAVARLNEDGPLLFVVDDVDWLDADDRALLERLSRTIDDAPSLRLLTAGRVAAPTGRQVELGPLPTSEVGQWLAQVAPHVDRSAFIEATGALPGPMVEALETMNSGRREPAALGLLRASQEKMTDGERAVLALVVASPWPILLALVRGLGLEQAASELTKRDVMAVASATLRLRHEEDRADLAEALATEMPAAHRALLAELDARGGADDLEGLARRLCHQAGAERDLSALLPEVHHAMERSAAPFFPLLRAPSLVGPLFDRDAPATPSKLASFVRSCPDRIAFVVALLERATEHRRTIAMAAKVLRCRPVASLRAALRVSAARAYAKLGEPRAVGSLRRALVVARPDERARLAADLGGLLLRRRLYGEARQVAEEALPIADAETRIDLLTTLAQAASYQGDESTALSTIATALQEGQGDRGSSRARLEHAAALLALRRGDLDEAVRRFDASLAIAKSLGLGELHASASVGQGALRHQLGDWGAASVAYETADRVSLAVGLVPQRLTIAFNRARLECDVGRFERARHFLARAEQLALGNRFMLAACAALRAEVASLERESAAYDASASEARAEFVALGATREVVEVELVEAIHRRRNGEVSRAVEALARARRNMVDAPADLEAAWWMTSASLKEDVGGSEAIELLERALEASEVSRQRPLIARVRGELARAYEAKGLHALADQARQSARAHWERILAGLDADAAKAFVNHPERRDLFEVAAPGGEPTKGDSRELQRLRQLMAINRRLATASTTLEVVEAAVDAVLELTRAEYGLVLMPGKDQVDVFVARTTGGRPSGRDEARFSRGIAERVLASGEPIVSLDAEVDSRLRRHRSVHALQLRSVLAVPIREGRDVIGVLGVHTRAAARLGPDDVEVAASFADQVGVALSRARMLDALAANVRALEAAKEQNEALLRAQAKQIVHLEMSTKVGPSASDARFPNIVGTSPALKRALDVVSRVASADVSVLIRGESGTGKELVARAVHEASDRSARPLVAINCGALPAALLEAELFGHVKGAFTGAARDREGLFVAADGGTLFLDEIGEMPEALQVKLLRVLQEREVMPLGSERVRKVDVRVVSATHRDLAQAIRAGRFREDLYYRLAVVEINVPPLRDRRTDIPALVDRIMTRLASSSDRLPKIISPAAMKSLLDARWPGNVRELENVVARAFFLSEGLTIEAFDIGEDRGSVSDEARPSRTPAPANAPRGYLVDEANRMREALVATGWNVAAAARSLGVPRVTFHRRMMRWSIEPPPRATGKHAAPVRR